jgi:hypothetical protein
VAYTGAFEDSTDEWVRRARIVFAAGGAALVVGTLLPWARVSAGQGGFTVSGVDDGRGGWITLGLGLVAIVLATMRTGRVTAVVGGLAGLGALVVAVENWIDLRRIIEHFENTQPAPVSGAIGVGLWLIVIAAATIVGVAGWTMGIAWRRDGAVRGHP